MTPKATVLDVVRAAGLDLQRRGEEWAISCPGPAHRRGDRRPSLRVNELKDAWRCDACDAGGGPVALREWLGLPAEVQPAEDLHAVDDPEARDALAVRGLVDRVTLADLRVARRGSPMIAFPYRDAGGRLLFRKLRPLDWEVKRFHVEPRGVAPVLYRLPALADLPGDGAVVVVEGELDALTLAQAGIRGAVSVPNGTGTRLTPEMLAPLRRFARIAVAVDADDAGEKLAGRLAVALGPGRCVRVRFDVHKDANAALTAGWGAAQFAEALAAGAPMAGAGEGVVAATGKPPPFAHDTGGRNSAAAAG